MERSSSSWMRGPIRSRRSACRTLTAGNTNSATFGALPLGFIKLVSGNFSIQAGKLPTLIGAEYGFTYENMNISRGLLWNQEPLISRGVQANYTAGPVAFSVSWNDGFYSDRFNWASGAATWTINTSNSLEFIAAGNLGTTDYGTSATPEIQNNDKEIYNVIYSYTSGAWIAQAYFQYADTGNSAAIGVKATSSTGVGVLVNYAVPNTSLESLGPRRGHLLLGQRGRRLSQPPLRSGEQGVVLHVHADLPGGRALRARRGLLRRGVVHDAGLGLRHKRVKHLADPFRDRDRHPILSLAAEWPAPLPGRGPFFCPVAEMFFRVISGISWLIGLPHPCPYASSSSVPTASSAARSPTPS